MSSDEYHGSSVPPDAYGGDGRTLLDDTGVICSDGGGTVLDDAGVICSDDERTLLDDTGVICSDGGGTLLDDAGAISPDDSGGVAGLVSVFAIQWPGANEYVLVLIEYAG